VYALFLLSVGTNSIKKKKSQKKSSNVAVLKSAKNAQRLLLKRLDKQNDDEDSTYHQVYLYLFSCEMNPFFTPDASISAAFVVIPCTCVCVCCVDALCHYDDDASGCIHRREMSYLL